MTNFRPFDPEKLIGKLKKPLRHCDVLWQLLPEIKKNIEYSPTKITSISTNDFKKKLGPNYEKHSLSTIYQMARYGLFEDGIDVKHTVIENDDHLLMRYSEPENKIPKGLEWAKKSGYVCKEGKQVR